VLTNLAEKRALDDEIVSSLRTAAESFKETFSA